jgi:3-methyladenine DNA glycosylase AlkD
MKHTSGSAVRRIKPEEPVLRAKDFIEELRAHQSDAELKKIQRYFKSGSGEYGAVDKFMGVRMGTVFALAKKYIGMDLREIEKLLDNDVHEARTGAVSIMDFQARNKKTTPQRKKELFDLYIGRHDRINNWDLVDRSAPYVVGGYLSDKPRKILYRLALSKNVWERRTAIVSTFYFIRQGDLDDTFRIAEMLIRDPHDLIHKAAGGWLRAAGAKDKPRLLEFMDRHSDKMPRTMLRYAIEHLTRKEKDRYMKMRTVQK